MKLLLRRTLAALICCMPLAVSGQTVTVSPHYPYIGVGFTQQFTAQVTGLTNTDVKWSVAGKVGGDSVNGTISTAGLYTAPLQLPGQNPVTVRATASDGKTTSFQYVLIESLGPTLTSVSPNPAPTGNYTITVTGVGFQQGAQVFVGPYQMSSTFVSSSKITAAGYQGAAGNLDVKVKNPGSIFSNILSVPFVSIAPITVAPAKATVKLGATKQFTASGQSNVTWAASAGTISATGLYTAPASMPSSNLVSITASGTGNQVGTATVTLSAETSPAITVSPATASVALGATKQFTASGQTTVTWSASAGSISAIGLFTAPASMPSSSSVTITATGTGSQKGTAVVTLVNSAPPSITVAPSTVNVNLGATQQFTATGQAGVTWSASAGSIDVNGLFTAPATMPASNKVTITATGTGSQTGTATVTLVAPVTPITLSPTSVSIALGATQQFTATGPPSVTWSATAGSISATGLYTAPSVMPVLNTVTVTATAGAQSANAVVTLLAAGNPLVSSSAAHRFLEQAGFGPTPGDVAHLQAIGFQAWLQEQFAMPRVSTYNAVLNSSQGGLPNWFLANAVTNPDQLRQKVAFALSQIDVVSITKLIWNPITVPYEHMLMDDAFTNYRQILGDVTLSPAIGYYLDMANNAAAVPGLGTVANENYSREVMQLFSIGTNMLNADGSRQTDASGNLIATYDQKNVTELARVFTGWTFPVTGTTRWNADVNASDVNYSAPMASVSAYHDFGSKTLLNGYVAANGLTPAQDLQGALDNLFAHSNVGPFISKQLIQHMVKSNPSPAYVARVVAIFNNNGQNVRGDMQAVITAILLDPEARANDDGLNDQPTDGHLQEPVLFLSGVIRALGGQMNSQEYFSYDLVALGQDIYNPASVFNYYSPSYTIPNSTLKGGEFQIFNTYTSLYRANLISSVFNNYSDPVQTYGPGTKVDLTPYLSLASNPAALVNAFDNALTGGVLPAAFKQIIATAVQADKPSGALRQVQTALYLITTSNYYNVWH